MQPKAFGPRRKQRRRAHLRPWRHRVRPLLRLVPLYECRYRRDIPLHSDQRLHLVVVRRELAVLERPIRHVRAGHWAEQRQPLEVDVPHPGDLDVRVWERAADLVGQVIDVADVGVRRVLARGLPKRARVGQGIRLLEVAVLRLELVIGEHRRERSLPFDVGEVVRSHLEDHDVPAGFGELHRHDRPTRSGADDDRFTGQY